MEKTTKAISVRQPFAALIATGQKRLETRTWKTDYRGPLLICAGLNSHSLYRSYDHRTDTLILDNRTARRDYIVPWELFKISGSMICLVDLVGIQPFNKGKMMELDACCDWYPNAFAWELENVRLVEPETIKGQLRLFGVPDREINVI